jgi:hypothetical protein
MWFSDDHKMPLKCLSQPADGWQSRTRHTNLKMSLGFSLKIFLLAPAIPLFAKPVRNPASQCINITATVDDSLIGIAVRGIQSETLIGEQPGTRTSRRTTLHTVYDAYFRLLVEHSQLLFGGVRTTAHHSRRQIYEKSWRFSSSSLERRYLPVALFHFVLIKERNTRHHVHQYRYQRIRPHRSVSLLCVMHRSLKCGNLCVGWVWNAGIALSWLALFCFAELYNSFLFKNK